MTIDALHLVPNDVELLRADYDALTRTFLKNLDRYLQLRRVARAEHTATCGCEGDVCDLGHLLNETWYLDDAPPPAAQEAA